MTTPILLSHKAILEVLQELRKINKNLERIADELSGLGEAFE